MTRGRTIFVVYLKTQHLISLQVCARTRVHKPIIQYLSGRKINITQKKNQKKTLASLFNLFQIFVNALEGHKQEDNNLFILTHHKACVSISSYHKVDISNVVCGEGSVSTVS